MSSAPAIDVRDLSKVYRVAQKDPGLAGTMRHFFKRKNRDVHAVKSVSFTVEPGEFVGFLGPNGAGKTTTLKMLTGLIHPSGGSVSVLGHTPFDRKHELLRQITLVMGQKQQLIWDLPAMDSLRVNAAVYDVPEPVFRARIDELSKMLSITTQLTQPVRKLSLGERMKAELMAALIHQPTLLFLDEPTIGLDVNAQDSVRTFLKDYNQRTGATIILTSHYMADITALCKRVLLIHQGGLMYDGSLSGILERFAPYREVRIETAEPRTAEELSSFGEIEEHDGRVAKLLVRREVMTESVQRMLATLNVTDLSVGEPAIDGIIAKLFATGSVTGASEPGAVTSQGAGV